MNGDKYDGMWVKNKKNGKGVMNFSNGASYNGEWVDDKACNFGVITYVNKDVYDGIFYLINKVTSSMGRSMDKEHITTRLVENIKANGSKIKSQDMEQCSMPIKTNMKVTG